MKLIIEANSVEELMNEIPRMYVEMHRLAKKGGSKIKWRIE